MTLEIHASAPGSFHTCPFQWLCQEQKITEQETINTRKRDLGTLIHKMIEEYFKTTRGRTMTAGDIDYLSEVKFNSLWEQNKQKFPRLKKRAKRCMDNFARIEKQRLKDWRTYQPTFTEKYLEHGRFCGTMDFYSEEKKTIIDWKSGSANFLYDSNLIQGSIYKHLAQKNGFPVDRVYFALLYSGLFLEMPPQQPSWVKEQVTKMISMIENKQFPRRKSGICKNCGYKAHCELSKGGCLWKMTL